MLYPDSPDTSKKPLAIFVSFLDHNYQEVNSTAIFFLRVIIHIFKIMIDQICLITKSVNKIKDTIC